MKALILAGGEGTRLRPLTSTIPKSLLPICNRPFLEHQVRLLARHGIREAVLLTGYLPEAFVPFSTRVRAELGVGLEIAREEAPLGTAGAVRGVLHQLQGTTLVFNGDVLTDLDLGALVSSHRERRAALTIALARVEDAGPYGLVPVAADGRVEAFLEKPEPEMARRGGLINAGTYLLEPRVLADVPAGVMWSFERQVFPALLARGEPVYGFASDAYWIDIGTPARYLQAHRDALDGRIAVEVAGALDAGARVLVAPEASVDPRARLGPYAVVGPGARVGAEAVVEGSVLLDGAAVGERATVRDSIVGPGAEVRSGARLEGVTLAEGERA